ncbi:unnamed protein product [Timema podura]|uniref:Uncharacterized protein n=1 Tax=Timema podura TaxID=61482 RepID=A0ABN7NPQ6_TIMPD|nr:unnamed protein product [Timema podura]
MVSTTISINCVLASYITPCKNDENINTCAKESAKKAIPYFINGDRKYHIPNLVPLIISELKINQEGNQAIGFSFVAKNATVLGINTVEVDEVMIDLKSGHVEYHLLFPRIEIECDYDVKGKILLLPISGHGSGNITIRYVPHLPHPSYATDHKCAMPVFLSVCTLMRASSQLLRCNKRVKFLKLNLVYLVRGGLAEDMTPVETESGITGLEGRTPVPIENILVSRTQVQTKLIYTLGLTPFIQRQNLTNVKVKYVYTLKINQRDDGKNYTTPVNPTLDFELINGGRVYITLSNLFNGDKLLGDNMNQVLNENWEALVKDVGPALAEAIGEAFRQILAGIFDLVSIEEAFIF